MRLESGEESRNSDNVGQVTRSKQPETEKSLLTKLKERKARENNMIHGVQEIITQDDKERNQYNDTKVNNILHTCKI